MTTQEFTKALDDIKADLRDLFQSALESRDAANEMLDKKHALDMKITQMQTKAMQDELATRKGKQQ